MKIIAHRGASGIAPENTRAAMELAIKYDSHGIETDLQVTKDGEVVVFHDWLVDRTTDGKGAVKDLTFEEISKLDAGSWFSDEFKGERVLKLEELLDIVPATIILNLELKSEIDSKMGLEEKVIEILNKKKRKENIVISSFDHLCLKKVRSIDENIKIGLLYEAYLIDVDKYMENLDIGIYSAHPKSSHVNKKYIDQMHELDLKVYSWTVNDKEEAEKLKSYGIDGIITNYPNLLK